ncbi:uncharacterized protein LOC131891819 [Tigriopus californicus]|uniref:uncharacterized protein LOC131891819 n=1 Tax=Tigriopus californicus TaxID=6832 RepID=UPI0027DAB205|nr:uncharacterized protein LOC131891819 [Tigriopus californicus]
MTSGLITCFFDPVHQIRPERMQIHLYKCKKQHPTTPFKICPLNSTHYVKPEDLEAHVEDCPDKGEVMSHILAKNCYRFNAPKPVDRSLPEVDEWQELQGKQPFNPTLNAKSKGVVRVLKAASKSEKKRFYEAEELRHQQLTAQTGGRRQLPHRGFQPLRSPWSSQPRLGMSAISESPSEISSISTLASTKGVNPRVDDEFSLISASTKLNGLGRGWACVTKKVANYHDEGRSSTTTSVAGLGRGRGREKTAKAIPSRPGWLKNSIPSTSGDDPFAPFEDGEFSEFDDKISIK